LVHDVIEIERRVVFWCDGVPISAMLENIDREASACEEPGQGAGAFVVEANRSCAEAMSQDDRLS
jgi:hypothetical protein